MARVRARVDDNQGAIVALLRACGCLVQPLHNVGHGVPDLLIYDTVSGRLVLAEVKDGHKPPSRQSLTSDELAWHTRWQGAPVYIVNGDTAALAMLDELRGS